MTQPSYAEVAHKTTPEDFPKLEAFANQYPDREYIISIEVPEFTCLCPKTGLPDFATLAIDYYPDETCLELKAFKYYTVAYRNVGMFHENIVNKFLDDIVAVANPRAIRVYGEFNARGGILTSVTATHFKSGYEDLPFDS